MAAEIPPGGLMASTATKPGQVRAVNPSALAAPAQRPQGATPYPGVAVEKKAAGYGLPCSHCHAYYPSDMPACPICKCSERVSPSARVMHTTPAVAAAAAQPAAGIEIDAERERLLKELKSQAFASHNQINTAATFRCVLSHQHSGASEPAAVCHSCYSEARQQADRLEAALHMDAKEAAKIVYDAVWADTSDPNASYFNAAQALLTELRKRAGVGIILGSHQSLTH
jgi:hypothetical protein